MHIIWLSLIPCLIWLAFFYIQDWYQREPLWLIGVTFLLGAASALVALVINSMGSVILLGMLGHTTVYKLAELWLVVGPVEEFVKMGAVLVFVYRRPEFDEPVDGVIYAAAAALGFAALENIIYLVRHGEQIIILRGIFANSGHALDSALWGLALSKAKAAPNVASKRAGIIAGGWLLAAGVHALYDTFCFIGGRSVLVTVGMLLLFMVVMFTYVEIRLIKHVVKSPHRKATMFMRTIVRCSRCNMPTPSGSPCWKCGNVIAASDGSESKYCLRCGVPQQPGATQCSNCGISLLEFSGSPTLESRPHFVRAGSRKFAKGEIAYVIDKPDLTIGKTLENNFVLQDDSISKHHARCMWHHQVGAHVLYDVGATNGVYVNGQRVTMAYLSDGFEVRLGSVRLVYRLAGWRSQGQVPAPVAWIANALPLFYHPGHPGAGLHPQPSHGTMPPQSHGTAPPPYQAPHGHPASPPPAAHPAPPPPAAHPAPPPPAAHSAPPSPGSYQPQAAAGSSDPQAPLPRQAQAHPTVAPPQHAPSAADASTRASDAKPTVAASPAAKEAAGVYAAGAKTVFSGPPAHMPAPDDPDPSEPGGETS